MHFAACGSMLCARVTQMAGECLNIIKVKTFVSLAVCK